MSRIALEHRVLDDGCHPDCLACHVEQVRARIRAATDRALERGCDEASFVEFMDTVCPGWRS